MSNSYYRWFPKDWFGSRTRAALDPATANVFRDFIDLCMDCGDNGHATDNGKPVALEDLSYLLSTPRHRPEAVLKCLKTLIERGAIKENGSGYYNDRSVVEADWRRRLCDAARKAGTASGVARGAARTAPENEEATQRTVVERSLNGRSTVVERSLNDRARDHARNSDHRSQSLRSQNTELKDQDASASLSSEPPVPRTEGRRKQVPNCPHLEIIRLWNDCVPTQPPVTEEQLEGWLAANGVYVRQRWNESAKRQNLDYWQQYFESVSNNGWLSGRIEGDKGSCFVRGLEWFVQKKNMARVESGEFHLRESRLGISADQVKAARKSVRMAEAGKSGRIF